MPHCSPWTHGHPWNEHATHTYAKRGYEVKEYVLQTFSHRFLHPHNLCHVNPATSVCCREQEWERFGEVNLLGGAERLSHTAYKANISLLKRIEQPYRCFSFPKSGQQNSFFLKICNKGTTKPQSTTPAWPRFSRWVACEMTDICTKLQRDRCFITSN